MGSTSSRRPMPPIKEHCQVYTTQVAYAATCHHVLKLEDLAEDYSLFEVLLHAYGVNLDVAARARLCNRREGR